MTLFARFSALLLSNILRETLPGFIFFIHIPSCIWCYQKPIRVETCNGPLCAGKQASDYSIC